MKIISFQRYKTKNKMITCTGKHKEGGSNDTKHIDELTKNRNTQKDVHRVRDETGNRWHRMRRQLGTGAANHTEQ